MPTNMLKTKAKSPTDSIFGVDTEGRVYHKPLSEMVHLLVAGMTGCHAEGEQILMADGSTKAVELINGGDEVMGADGTPRLVICPREGVGDMYEVSVDGIGTFTANGEHNLIIRDKNDNEVVMTVHEFLALCEQERRTYRIPIIDKPAQFVEQKEELPIDPYFLGVLLGDGALKSSSLSVTTADEEVVTELYENANALGMQIREEDIEGTKAKHYYFNNGIKNSKPTKLSILLSELGLINHRSHDKFIPDLYKKSSISNRRKLLAGLIDTDGSLKHRSTSTYHYRYVSKSEQLIDDLVFLCRSLGIWAAKSSFNGNKNTKYSENTYYQADMRGNFSNVPIKIQRKQCLLGNVKPRENNFTRKFDIKKIGDNVKHYGFTCEGGEYVLSNFVCAHNSGKSVYVNQLLITMMSHATPDEVRITWIDRPQIWV